MEIARAAQILRFFAGEAFRPKGEVYEQAATGTTLYTLRRPLGVVGLITPWNFPAAIPAWKLAPALAYGNTVVLKPAQEAPLTTLHLAACLEEGGIPAGRAQRRRRPRRRRRRAARRAPGREGDLVHRLGRGRRAAAHRRDRARQARPARARRPEPAARLADADLDRAVEACFAGAYWSAGQKCTSTRRIYVQDAVYDDVPRAAARADRRAASSATRSTPRPRSGRSSTRARSTRCSPGSSAAATRAARCIAGGKRHRRELLRRADAVRGRRRRGVPLVRGGVRAGRLALPLRRPRRGARARERRALRPLRVDLHARRRRDRHVRPPDRGRADPREPQTAGADFHVPFGGVKGSGYGPHEQGRAAIEFYTEVVTVYADV